VPVQVHLASVKNLDDSGLFAGQVQTEVGVGNQLLLSNETLRKNTRAVQKHNEIEVTASTTRAL
jgi:hypothetical protein